MSGKRGKLAVAWAQKGQPQELSREPATQEEVAGEKRKGQTLRLNIEAWKTLKVLGIEREKPVHDLLVEAVNDLLIKHGKAPIA